jgi:hypothetical protein
VGDDLLFITVFGRHQIECLTGSEKIVFPETNLMCKHSSECTIQVN